MNDQSINPSVRQQHPRIALTHTLSVLAYVHLVFFLSYRTSYDNGTKEYFLSVYRGKVHSRFLVKDSYTDMATVKDVIARTVDAIIAKLDRYCET